MQLAYNVELEQMTRPDDKLLKTAEVAERLNVSPNKVLQLLQQNALVGTRLGTKTIRIYESSVNALIELGATNAAS